MGQESVSTMLIGLMYSWRNTSMCPSVWLGSFTKSSHDFWPEKIYVEVSIMWQTGRISRCEMKSLSK